MKKQTYIPYILTVMLLSFFTETQATLLFYEGFDYGASDGLLTSVSDWTLTAANDDAQYKSSGLSYGSLSVSGGMAQSTTSWGSGTRNYELDIPDISGESEIWISMLLQAPGTVSSGSDSYFGVNMSRNNGSNYYAYGAGKQWSDQTYQSLGNAGGPIFDAEYADLGTDTFMLAFRFTDGDLGEVWVNPSLSGAPTAGTGQDLGNLGSGAMIIDHLILNFRSHQQNMDELRIGTSFADVSPIPEPGALSLMAIAGCVLLGSRRFWRAKRG